MKKHPLLNYLTKKKLIQQLIADVESHDVSTSFLLTETSSAFKHVLISLLRGQLQDKFICFTSTPEKASELYFDLSSMIDEDKLHLLALPEHHLHLLHEDIDPEVLRTVDTLLAFNKSESGILILPVHLLALQYPGPKTLEEHSISIQRGKSVPFKQFTNSLMFQGFERKDYVSQQGEISIRGRT
jgi:transcription-repair coupling factor (superfamily II helicase)